MKLDRYEIILYWSDEDGCFVGEVPQLSGCMAHGATQAKALAATRQAIRAWIDVAREFGREVPMPKSGRLMVA